MLVLNVAAESSLAEDWDEWRFSASIWVPDRSKQHKRLGAQRIASYPNPGEVKITRRLRGNLIFDPGNHMVERKSWI